jgi:hypothetical protein
VIAELQIELDLLRRATRYIVGVIADEVQNATALNLKPQEAVVAAVF